MQSTYVKTQDANWIKGINYPAAPSSLWLSLHSDDPSLTGANGIALDRVSTSTYSAIATDGSKRLFSVSSITTFTNPLSDGTASYFGVWDSAVTGNYLGGGRIVDEFGEPSTIAYTTGNDIIIPANSIYIAYNTGIYSNFFIDAKLNWYKGSAFPAAPSNIYTGVGLDLTSSGGGTDSGLARQLITFGTSFTSGDYIAIQSSNALSFGLSPTPDGLMLNTLSFYDSISDGNLICVAPFRLRNYLAGVSIGWAIGAINLEF